MKLRDYQKECVDTVLKKFNTINSQLVQLPTGSGKTVILWHVLKELNMKSLIIAPTCELTEQLEDTGCIVVNPKTVYLKKKSFWPKNKQHLIMTGQSATFALKGNMLSEYNPDILIIDEAHRSQAKTIKELIKVFKDKKAKILGLTATPERLDGRSLLEVYDELTYERNLPDLINQGYLVDIECYKIKTKVKPKEIKFSGYDIAKSVLKELDVESRNKLILDVYLNRCKGKKTLVFCLSVSHAQTMAETFRKEGVLSEAIHGGMNKTARKNIIRKFKSGEIKVLCNCQLLTEGFDEPSIEALILARPTKSKALFCQMIGRGVRPYKNKKACYVYDFSDEIHNICSFNVLGNIPNNVSFEIQDGERFTQALERNKSKLEDLEYEYEKYDLYEKSEFWTCSAFKHQLDKLDQLGIRCLEEPTAKEAEYLIFKNNLLGKYGYDTEAYWKTWNNV